MPKLKACILRKYNGTCIKLNVHDKDTGLWEKVKPGEMDCISHEWTLGVDVSRRRILTCNEQRDISSFGRRGCQGVIREALGNGTSETGQFVES